MDFTGGVNEAINMREGGYEHDEEKKTELFEVRPTVSIHFLGYVYTLQ